MHTKACRIRKIISFLYGVKWIYILYQSCSSQWDIKWRYFTDFFSWYFCTCRCTYQSSYASWHVGHMRAVHVCVLAARLHCVEYVQEGARWAIVCCITIYLISSVTYNISDKDSSRLNLAVWHISTHVRTLGHVRNSYWCRLKRWKLGIEMHVERIGGERSDVIWKSGSLRLD